MKIIRIFFLAVFLIVSNVVLADSHQLPPPDQSNGTMGTAGVDEDGIPPIADVPINEDLPYLILSGLILGTVIIYRNKLKKASV
ncbi:hypothetical protein [Flavobacterium gelatinilyticum]|uniref:hypothetical protein n=1 Tax=Flavobacterium gelatinilyticum TaxID=3003260 RepID=UPI00248047AA|nr:hypothetical protein [Flavobacterium gelatinilyticum]